MNLVRNLHDTCSQDANQDLQLPAAFPPPCPKQIPQDSFWVPWAPLGLPFGHPWAPPGRLFGSPGLLLGPPWRPLDPFWIPLDPFWVPVGSSWTPLGPHWGPGRKKRRKI